MSKVPYKVVKKLFSEIKAVHKFDTDNKTVFQFENVIITIPKDKDMDSTHLINILESQLDMSWWMIDHLFGTHNIK